MDKEIFRELCMAHALGSLEGDEPRLFEQALAEADEEGLAMFAEAVALAQNLSLAAPSAEPSPMVKDRLMTKVRRNLQSEKTPMWSESIQLRSGMGREMLSEAGQRVQTRPIPSIGFSERLKFAIRVFGPGLAFASAALGIGVLIYAFSLQGMLGQKEAALEHSHRRITALEDTISRKEALLEVLLSHNLQVAVLSGEGPSPMGYGKMIWCPKRRCGILHVSNLPVVPEGKDYQLWLVRAAGPTSAGVFQVTKTSWDGDLFRIQAMAEVTRDTVKGFFITLEPKGGVTAPTGATYLKGSTLM